MSQWRKRFFDQGLTAWRSAAVWSSGVFFPRWQIAEVRALACELPAEKGVPLSSRWSSAELAREAVARGIVERISGVIVWRWVSADAIRPWNYRSSIFPRDPQFREKAGRILDLYEGRWEGQLLEPGDFVVCADEKPRSRRGHASIRPPPPSPRAMASWSSTSTTSEERSATWPPGTSGTPASSTAARPRMEIEPFDALVEQFMSIPPYDKARRVFLVVDNGSAHRGKRLIKRLQGAWKNLIVVHTPVHASWAEPVRDLLLDRAAQGAAAQQLR